MKSIRTERRNGTNRCHAVTIQDRALLVYLPPSYSSGDRHYPVAYVQDGGGLIDDCANYLELLFREGKLPELILVGVATQNRNDEYTPWPAPALLAGRPDFGGAARSYLNELADTVKPYIDQHYRTQPASGHTGVIGASLGGMVSMLAGYWRPDVFGRIGMLSASLWYEGVMDFIREQAPPTEGMRIYMSVGGSEGVYKTNVQRNMVSFSRETHRLWLEKGFPPHRLRFDVEEGGTHDPLFMARRFPEALRFLFGGSGASGEGALRPARREDGLREGRRASRPQAANRQAIGVPGGRYRED
ncbi:alpha/beta hydrolase [Paenibacillus thailandensis]|uniref:Alpha/beta hydrolase n=1 Tax=Paenibacillus thailandensis TaxID=393250 RepID=A0ABW5QWB6_9BACL